MLPIALQSAISIGMYENFLAALVVAAVILYVVYSVATSSKSLYAHRCRASAGCRVSELLFTQFSTAIYHHPVHFLIFSDNAFRRASFVQLGELQRRDEVRCRPPPPQLHLPLTLSLSFISPSTSASSHPTAQVYTASKSPSPPLAHTASTAARETASSSAIETLPMPLAYAAKDGRREKMIKRVSFMLGLMNVGVSGFIIGAYPTMYYLWYAVACFPRCNTPRAGAADALGKVLAQSRDILPCPLDRLPQAKAALPPVRTTLYRCFYFTPSASSHSHAFPAQLRFLLLGQRRTAPVPVGAASQRCPLPDLFLGRQRPFGTALTSATIRTILAQRTCKHHSMFSLLFFRRHGRY